MRPSFSDRLFYHTDARQFHRGCARRHRPASPPRCTRFAQLTQAPPPPQLTLGARFAQRPAPLVVWHDLPEVPSLAELARRVMDLAQEHFDQGDFAAASAFTRLLSQRLPEDQLWEQLGHLHLSLCEYEAAGRAFGYAAAFRPHDATLQAKISLVCLRLGDQPSYQGYLKRALALDPANHFALELLKS